MNSVRPPLFIALAVALVACSANAATAPDEAPTPAADPAPAPQPAPEQSPTAAAETGEAEVVVRVHGLRSAEGKVLAYLYDSESSFPIDFAGAAKTRKSASLADGKASLRFSGVPAGTYALVVVHDENGNGQLDKNFVGMPKEGVGASNHNKRGRPKWSVCKFEVSGSVTQRVKVNYM